MSKEGRNRITMVLLCGAIMFLVVPTLYRTLPNDRQETYLITHAEDLEQTELEKRVIAYEARGSVLDASPTAPDAYFMLREDSFPLQYAAKKFEARQRARGDVTGRVAGDRYIGRIAAVLRNAVNEDESKRRHRSPEQFAAFFAARDRSEERMKQKRQPMLQELGPGMSAVEFGIRWLKTLFACLPFGMCWVVLRFRNYELRRSNRDLPWKKIGAEFLGKGRPWAASFVPVVGPLFLLKSYRDYDFNGTLKVLTYALGMIVSGFTGGIGPAVVKAQIKGEKNKKSMVSSVVQAASGEKVVAGNGPDPQAPAPKKKRTWTKVAYFRFTEANIGEPNQQPQGLVRLTFTDPSGNDWIEGQEIVNRSSVTEEVYGGRFLVNRKTSFFERIKVGLYGGFSMTETRHTVRRIASYRALIGSRLNVVKGRFSIVSPFTQVELPLNDRARWSIVSTLRTGWRFTKRFSLVQETSLRGTRGAKPTAGYVGLFGMFKVNPRLTFEFGPTLTQKGLPGFRTGAIVNF